MENKWDQRYSQPGYAYGICPNDFLVDSLSHLPPGGELLCLAEGEGRNAVYLAGHGYKVTAVDSSAVGLNKARALADKRGVTIITEVADLNNYLLPLDRYDGIISIFCHLPPPLRKKVYRQIPAALRPGGVFLLEGYTPRQLAHRTGGPPDPQLLVEVEELCRELAALDILHAVEVEREIREGHLHHGIGAVAQFIAVKKG